jgi:LmbE family N-acetylglucosaminyl deacetylase
MMWMAASEGTMMHVDITATFEKKVAALRCHASQTDQIEDLEELLREWAAGVAASARMELGLLAEGFRVINTE